MALFTTESVRANLRNKEGRRVFYLGPEDRLTPGARDFLRDHHIEILPAAQAKPQSWRTPLGGEFRRKPEYMTHLNGETLVPKDHPRILFRGQADTLEADLLLAQWSAMEEGYRSVGTELGQCLELVRTILARDVLEQPLEQILLGGLDEEQLRARSHRPQDFYGQPHFMPTWEQGRTLLLVNRARTTARAAELACYGAFRDREGLCTREDLLLAFNRLSSFLWILEIRLASGKEERAYGKR